MKTTIQGAFALVMLALSSVSCPARLYVDIEADHATVITNGAYIRCGDKDFKLGIKHDVGDNVFLPVITTNQHLNGHQKSFYFQMDAHPGKGTSGEKMFMDVATTTNGYGAKFSRTNTLGFAIRLAKGFEPPDENLMLSEWWQGSPYGPPLQLFIKPGTTQWQLSCGNGIKTETIPGNTLEANQWYYFTISVTPNLGPTNGIVKVWQDGKLVIDRSDIPIGYDPERPLDPKYGRPLRAFYVEAGLYRPAQPRQAGAYFDSIRWGDTFEDVQPKP
ncbi:MAG TPA: heparin lyase I family protein [Candidatus Aquilonibacter sp.]|nr:heparin lyase I family protein [Candidatus Aquilonibacter sp.]